MHATMKLKVRIIIVSAVLLTVAASSFAIWEVRRHARREEASPFLALTFTDSRGTTLAYRLLLPEGYVPARRYPLLLFLHGSADRGNDNVRQLGLIAPLVTAESARRRFPCFVLVPQCPDSQFWVYGRYAGDRFVPSRKLSRPLQAVLELLDDVDARYTVDRRRLYVGGISMGGSATWDLIIRYPRRFAAAFPICGRGDVGRADRLASKPIRIFHGAQDTLVDVHYSRDMAAAIDNAGGHPVYTEYPELGHDIGARALGERYLLDWLFAQEL